MVVVAGPNPASSEGASHDVRVTDWLGGSLQSCSSGFDSRRAL